MNGAGEAAERRQSESRPEVPNFVRELRPTDSSASEWKELLGRRPVDTFGF
jgi:hypothetical protein